MAQTLSHVLNVSSAESELLRRQNGVLRVWSPALIVMVPLSQDPGPNSVLSIRCVKKEEGPHCPVPPNQAGPHWEEDPTGRRMLQGEDPKG